MTISTLPDELFTDKGCAMCRAPKPGMATARGWFRSETGWARGNWGRLCQKCARKYQRAVNDHGARLRKLNARITEFLNDVCQARSTWENET